MKFVIYAPLSIGGIGFLHESLKKRFADIEVREDRNAYRVGQGEPSGVSMALTDGLRIPMNKMRDEYNAMGKPVLVTDLGYVRRDLGYMQLGINKLNWLPSIACPSDRWDRLDVTLADRQYGDYILITGQKPYDGSHGMGEKQLQQMYSEWVQEIKQHTTRKIVFRPHPKYPQMVIEGAEMDVPTDINSGGLKEAISGAHCVVTYNSTSGTDALIAGVPVVAMSDTAQFYDVAEHDLANIENPRFPDNRQCHFNRVAYAQWTVDELRNGGALEFILEQAYADYYIHQAAAKAGRLGAA